MLVALGVIYLGGWSWLGRVQRCKAAWIAGVRPFILPTSSKWLGASLLPQLQRLIAEALTGIPLAGTNNHPKEDADG
jgi:biotin transporter BioY